MKISNPKLGGGVPVGTLAYWPGTAATLAAIEDDWIIANGATLNKSLYPELFKSIGYTYGGSGDNFLIPYMVDKKYVRCSGSSGTIVTAAAPNIKGTFLVGDGNILPIYNSTQVYFSYFTGATKSYEITPPGTGATSEVNSPADLKVKVNFDASNYSSVYSDKVTTIRPYSMDMIPIIKVK